jgi:hypothetical protein
MQRAQWLCLIKFSKSFLISSVVGIFLLAGAGAAQHRLTIGKVKNENRQTVAAPVYLSSDSAITLLQFVVEYDSARLRSISPSVQLGAQAGALVISQTNRALPFPPLNPQANRNFLVQLSGGGTQFVKGDSLEILKLRWQVQASYGDSIALGFDGTPGRTFLTTFYATDIVAPTLRLNAGAVLVRDLTPPVSAITFPTTGGKITSANVAIAGTATDAGGLGVGKVEVSTDGGSIWHPATNTGVDFSTWSYAWSNLANGSFTLKSRAIDKPGNIETPGSGVTVVVDRTGVASGGINVPLAFALGQNYPNPFLRGAKSSFSGNPETAIAFALPKSTRVTIRIFDLVGKEIRALVDAAMAPGYHQALWDGKDGAGNLVPAGIYLYKMQAGEFVAVKKSVIVR